MKEYLVMKTKIKERKRIRYYKRKEVDQRLEERDIENKSERDRKKMDKHP